MRLWTCDRCGLQVELEASREFPASWTTANCGGVHGDLCWDCGMDIKNQLSGTVEEYRKVKKQAEEIADTVMDVWRDEDQTGS